MAKGNSKISIISDEPLQVTKDAFFGFEQYSKTLTESVLYTETPVTFGIFGGWGTGKTSLMRLIYNQLKEDEVNEDIFPVWFEPWRYENEPNLIVPLLYTIRDEIRRANPKRKSQNPYSKLASFLDVFIKALARGVEASVKFNETTFTYKAQNSLNAVQELTKEYSKSKKLEAIEKSPYYDLYYYLQQVIDDLFPARIVIFVDDLDRCRPTKAVSILESIKLTMNIPGVIFVVAAEREILERISTKGKYDDETLVDGHSFLKKIIQVFFALPPLKEDEIARYVETLVKEMVRSRERKAIVNMFVYGAGPNPREIKRLVNNFSLLRELSSSKTKATKTAFLLVMQQRWPQIFQNVLDHRKRFIDAGTWLSSNWDKFPENMDDLEVILRHFPANIQENVRLLSFDVSFLEFIKNSEPDLSFSGDELDEYIHFSSIASLGTLRPDELRFIQTIEKQDDSTQKKWIIKAEASDTILERIDNIVYYLPASKYPNHQRTTSRQTEFMISDVGETNISIRIKVNLKSGENMTYTHSLDLND